MSQPQLSPAYTLAIFLSLPAGLLLAIRYHAGLSPLAVVLLSMSPAVVVCLIAYLHTHRMK